jgi:hypothetical protein
MVTLRRNRDFSYYAESLDTDILRSTALFS